MPVTFDTRQSDKPRRGAKGGPAPREAAILAATDPQEKRAGRLALGLWLGALLVLCAPWWFKSSTQTVGLVMLLWCAFAIVGFVLIAPTRVLGPLRKEPKARVSSKNRASLQTVLGKVAPLLGAAQPEAYLDAGAQTPRLRTLPGALIVNEPLWKQVSESEVNALAVRGVAHQRLGHARRLAIIGTFESLPSPLIKVLAWPVWIYVGLLESLWLQHAQQSADRIALLVIRNFGLLLSAIVKEKSRQRRADAGIGRAIERCRQLGRATRAHRHGGRRNLDPIQTGPRHPRKPALRKAHSQFASVEQLQRIRESRRRFGQTALSFIPVPVETQIYRV